jgi:hypothetical protein
VPVILGYLLYAALCALLLVWSNARGGIEELWRVALIMAALTGAYALLEWHLPLWALLERPPAGNCWAGTDSRCFPFAVLIGAAAISILEAVRVPRSVQTLIAATAAMLVLLSRYGLYLPIEVPGAA